jgi:hypothetical protein
MDSKPNENNSIPRGLLGHELLKDLPYYTIRDAWFISSHLILDKGDKVAVFGLRHRDGTLTYAIAALNPDIHVVGIDTNKQAIESASKTYSLPNLHFQIGDPAKGGGFEKESLNAVINAFTLHTIYTENQYDENAIKLTLSFQHETLKTGGFLLIRDYATPPMDEFVLMEMSEEQSKGESIEMLSESDLLRWYSEHSRPWDSAGCHGFFLEELPSRYPNTALFRLPYKWAYEFITQKDDRKSLQNELFLEHTYYTEKDFRTILRSLGFRVVYAAPHRDQIYIQKYFKDSFNLYKDDGTPLGTPPTSYTVLSKKVGENESLALRERRSIKDAEKRFSFHAVRNLVTGKISDIVTRDLAISEVLPYRISSDNKLKIFICEDIPRYLVGTIPRYGNNLDGKFWSGHMTEAISIQTHLMDEANNLPQFCSNYFGLIPEKNSTLEQGRVFFPAPDSLDELIRTHYINVKKQSGSTSPEKKGFGDIKGLDLTGKIREVDAQRLLNAISVGIIPNVRLEMQIQDLMEKLGIKRESWSDCPLIIKEETPDNLEDLDSLINRINASEHQFREVKGSAGDINSVQSVFINEGNIDGKVSGLHAENLEFITQNDETLNTVVVLPLTKHAETQQFMMGFTAEYLPVPERHGQNGFHLKAPSFPLPKDITTLDQLKQYIADQFHANTEDVFSLGESYFCHIGVTPQRVYPFAVATSYAADTLEGGVTAYADLRQMYRIIDMVAGWNADLSLMWCMKVAYRSLSLLSEIRFEYEKQQEKAAPQIRSFELHTAFHAGTVDDTEKKEHERQISIIKEAFSGNTSGSEQIRIKNESKDINEDLDAPTLDPS